MVKRRRPQARDGVSFRVITLKISPPWTCSLSRALASTCIVRLDRRERVWISITTHPTAEWVARKTTEAFPWNEAPRYMIQDRDCIYGAVVTRGLRAMGIRDKPTASCRTVDRIDPA
jgi:hypothetical protein